MPLKHRQDGILGEGNLSMHIVIGSGCVLQDRSGETASTSKIVTISPADHDGPAEKR